MVFSPSKKLTNRPLVKRDQPSSRSQFGALKLLKGNKPLSGKKIFLDVRNHSTAGRIETSIKNYGGEVKPFIDKDIELVVTDRPEWGGNVTTGAGGSPLYAAGTPRPSPSPSPLPHLFSPAASPAGNSRGSNFSPSTLDSPVESNGGGRRHPKTRAEAMIERVRSQPQSRTRDPLVDAQNWGLIIWSVEKILKFLQKIAHCQKKVSVDSPIISSKLKSDTHCNKVKSRSGKFFVKIESLDRQFRPSYKDLPCWPTINLNSEPGSSPFMLKPVFVDVSKYQNKSEVPVKKEQSASQTVAVKLEKPVLRRSPRKQNSPSKRNPSVALPSKKCGATAPQPKERASLVPPRPPSKRHPERSLFPDVKKDVTAAQEPFSGYCEICRVDYLDLRKHCQTDAHTSYSTNAENYASLDNLTQSVNEENFYKSLCELNSRSNELEVCNSSTILTEADDASKDKMRQPVDDRHVSSKMVGRKEALEVQCNGISNHVQTRVACTKGDRENLGGIFLDDRLTSAQLRKRRSISVSCKDLLEIAPGSERTHYLRSGRPARSELSQLSPALSDNSHPLLNSNSQQPLLSPTLSERGHHLRTRSQLWSNLIDEESLLVTANNHSDKSKSVEKCDKSEKLEKSSAVEDVNHMDVEEKDKSLQDVKEHDLRPPRNHSRNQSIRRKRLSAEEKLIEDNRGYYKVEVLNSKLRSTGLYVNHQANQDTVNGTSAQNGAGRSLLQGEKEPVVVRFKKVRRSELSVLSDEAENFMFGEQTKSESNSDLSSESEDEEEDDDEEDDDEDDDDLEKDDENDDCAGHEENGPHSRSSRSSQRNGRRSRSWRSRDRPHRLKIRVGNDNTYTRCSAGDSTSSTNLSGVEANGYRKCRKRRTQAEAFITDNMDYYKFEMAGSRLRVHGSPTSTSEVDDVATQDKNKLPGKEELVFKETIDGTPCPIDDLHFSFESVPSSEVWFQTFQRQDRGEELYFPSLGEPSLVVLPYQIPRHDYVSGQRSMGKRRSKNSVRLPRKSPRCHASTLAILSSVVRRRSSRDPEKGNPPDDAVPDQTAEVEPKVVVIKQPPPSTSASDQQTVPVVDEDCVGGEIKIQEMAKSIDSLLGLVPGTSSDADKDQDVTLSKSNSKGRSRKKQSVKPVPSNVASVPDNLVTDSDREKDPSLNYLIDPAVLDELACTCDVVSDPRGGPTMDILSLLDSYSDCCCIVDDAASTEQGFDASCNSSECGASSTCETDRRMRKKRKRRNMTGWDKPKRKCLLRRDVVGNLSDDINCVKDSSIKDVIEEIDLLGNLTDSESNLQKVSNSISSPPTFQRKFGVKRKLRSSLSLADSSRRGNVPGQSRMHVMKMEKDDEVSLPAKKGKCRKLRRLPWSKAR